jgi:polysaccharide pyruvyl transferase WcaK-like protein
MGDVAVLQVAGARLSELWPEARIEVLTESPTRLQTFCPRVTPILESGGRAWFDHFLIARKRRKLTAGLRRTLESCDSLLRDNLPSLYGSALALEMKLRGNGDPETMRTFLNSLLLADLVVLSGSGIFHDMFHERVIQLLNTLGMANRLGTPIAMFSQGFGPVENPGLLEQIRKVLPRVELIAMREKLASPTFLASVEVASQRTIFTGDDSLELAFHYRNESLGTGIGVGVRLTAYSQMDQSMVAPIQSALRRATEKYTACIVPVPILLRDESDSEALRALLSGCEIASQDPNVLRSPADIIEQVGRCRIVVSGSYHSAVFALGQGIPVVAFAKSTYYRQKFAGLKDQYGDGLQVVEFDSCGTQLLPAIEKAWESAASLRPELLRITQQLIQMSRCAYAALAEILNAPKDGRASSFRPSEHLRHGKYVP